LSHNLGNPDAAKALQGRPAGFNQEARRC